MSRKAKTAVISALLTIALALGSAIVITPAAQSAGGGVSPERPASQKWKTAGASFYGPGRFTGYCGRSFISERHYVVAHQTLPCGSKVLFRRSGKQQRATVVDRGPFVAGREWDLSYALAKKLRLLSAGVGNVQYQVLSK